MKKLLPLAILTLSPLLLGGCASSGTGDPVPLLEGRHVIAIAPGAAYSVEPADQHRYLVDETGLRLLIGLEVSP